MKNKNTSINLTVPVKVDIDDFIGSVNKCQAEEIILGIDTRVANYDFTLTIIRKLIDSLKLEHEADGEKFDMSTIDNSGYDSRIEAATNKLRDAIFGRTSDNFGNRTCEGINGFPQTDTIFKDVISAYKILTSHEWQERKNTMETETWTE